MRRTSNPVVPPSLVHVEPTSRTIIRFPVITVGNPLKPTKNFGLELGSPFATSRILIHTNHQLSVMRGPSLLLFVDAFVRFS